MSGRPPIRGDRPWHGILSPNEVHSRTIRARATNPNTEDGYVTLDFDGLPSIGRYASIPWMWASFPSPGQGAWGRYMPFHNDMVKVSFDYDDTAHIVGFDVKGESPEVADGHAGCPKVRRASASGTLPLYHTLKSGEFDFMSIGGAYVFGSATGQLLMQGGPTTIVLTKSTNSIRTEAAQHVQFSGTSLIRYGQVRRKLAGSPGEVAGFPTLPNPAAIWNPDGSLSEYQIQVNKNVSGINVPMTRFALGAVTSDSGVPEISTSTGVLRRFVLEVFDSAGLTKVCALEGDAAGSVAIVAHTAPAFTISMPLATVSIKAPDIELGLVPTGGAVEGATLGVSLTTAIAKLTVALTPIIANGSVPRPALTSELATVATALEGFVADLAQAVTIATSKSVKVQV